jgi:hypothetical protein
LPYAITELESNFTFFIVGLGAFIFFESALSILGILEIFKYPDYLLNSIMLTQNPGLQTAIKNPLLKDIGHVHARIFKLKQKTKNFYFKVLLSLYQCPKCDGELTMTGQSQCSCLCGYAFDPTLVFQKSTCCSSRLIRKTYHYVCSRCKKVVPSRFLFDERLFDRDYFRQMMSASRARAKIKKEQMIRFLKESRSGELPFLQEPCLESVPGLVEDLDQFIGMNNIGSYDFTAELDSGFEMQDYRTHILSALNCGRRFFSNISHLGTDPRLDRVWRFVTLIFMQHDREVELTQYQNDLLIERLEG